MQPNAKHKLVIGLTGGIGAGKSLVAEQLASLGCAVIDADELAHRALLHPTIRQQLIAWLGDQILTKDGGVDRSALGRIVFEDPQQLHRLEQLIHPHVHRARASLHEQYQQDPQVTAIVEDCPLLLEVGLDKECGAIIFVDAPRSLRLERLAQSRCWTEGEIADREKNQWPLDKKTKQADYVVVNDADEAVCLAHVRGVLVQILQHVC